MFTYATILVVAVALTWIIVRLIQAGGDAAKKAVLEGEIEAAKRIAESAQDNSDSRDQRVTKLRGGEWKL